jgi:hypothetical protein
VSGDEVTNAEIIQSNLRDVLAERANNSLVPMTQGLVGAIGFMTTSPTLL